MRYWFDTEFIEDGKTIDLISIGIVAEDGRQFYAENIDADLSKASDWVKENVIKYLWSQQEDKSVLFAWSHNTANGGAIHYHEIAKKVRLFCSPEKYGKPEFWAYYASYDWVALCQLFGPMMELPKGFPMFCNDIKQECNRLGNPTLPKQESGNHIALYDALHNKVMFEFLQNL